MSTTWIGLAMLHAWSTTYDLSQLVALANVVACHRFMRGLGYELESHDMSLTFQISPRRAS